MEYTTARREGSRPVWVEGKQLSVTILRPLCDHRYSNQNPRFETRSSLQNKGRKPMDIVAIFSISVKRDKNCKKLSRPVKLAERTSILQSAIYENVPRIPRTRRFFIHGTAAPYRHSFWALVVMEGSDKGPYKVPYRSTGGKCPTSVEVQATFGLSKCCFYFQYLSLVSLL